MTAELNQESILWGFRIDLDSGEQTVVAKETLPNAVDWDGFVAWVEAQAANLPLGCYQFDAVDRDGILAGYEHPDIVEAIYQEWNSMEVGDTAIDGLGGTYTHTNVIVSEGSVELREADKELLRTECYPLLPPDDNTPPTTVPPVVVEVAAAPLDTAASSTSTQPTVLVALTPASTDPQPVPVALIAARPAPVGVSPALASTGPGSVAVLLLLACVLIALGATALRKAARLA